MCVQNPTSIKNMEDYELISMNNIKLGRNPKTKPPEVKEKYVNVLTEKDDKKKKFKS